MPKTLCIIPARGGSKRIPRKNIKDFLGKPIIAYSIEMALKSNLFDEVMVSTDDYEIARISKEYGAMVPFLRGSDNSDDFATTTDVISEVLGAYSIKGEKFDFVCCLYATSPLVTLERLVEGYNKLQETNCISVHPVLKFSYPIWRGLNSGPDGKSSMLWPEYINSRSQDLIEVFHDAGQWYWMNNKLFNNILFTDDTISIELQEFEAQDIDTMEDWHMAELKYKLRMENRVHD